MDAWQPVGEPVQDSDDDPDNTFEDIFAEVQAKEEAYQAKERIAHEQTRAAIEELRQQKLARQRDCLDDLPHQFKKPRTTLTLDNYFRCSADDLEAKICLKPIREVNLTGRATQKELSYAKLGPTDQKAMDRAMSAEWAKWTEFGAYKNLTDAQLKEIYRKNPKAKVIGTRWVLTCLLYTSPSPRD